MPRGTLMIQRTQWEGSSTKETEQPQGRPLGSNADPGVEDAPKTGGYQW